MKNYEFCLFFTIINVFHYFFPYFRSYILTVMIDVGQGDCNFVRGMNGNNYLKKLESAGYQLFDDYRKFLSSDGVKKVFGTFSLLGATDRLAKTSEKAISILEKNPKGFFIMIECGVPDQGGHGNRPDKTIFGTLATDYAAKIALEYAIRKRDTLVIVTADHETGGVSAENNPKNRKHVRGDFCNFPELPWRLSDLPWIHSDAGSDHNRFCQQYPKVRPSRRGIRTRSQW